MFNAKTQFINIRLVGMKKMQLNFFFFITFFFHKEGSGLSNRDPKSLFKISFGSTSEILLKQLLQSSRSIFNLRLLM